VDYAVGDGPWSVYAEDLDGDGDLDIAVACLIANRVWLLFNNGAGSFVTIASYPVGNDPIFITSADLDNDGDNDLITANVASGDVSILLNEGDSTFASAVNYPTGSNPRGVTVVDLNGDNLVDLAVVNTLSYTVSVLLNIGNAIFQSPDNYPVGRDPHSINAADLDGDGDYDLVTADYNSGNVSVLQNQGDGTFIPADSVFVGTKPISVKSADFDGDSRVDLAISLENNQIVILLNIDSSNFAAPDYYSVSGRTNLIVACDLDGNGAPDLVSSNDGSDNISVLLNQRPPIILATLPYQNELNVAPSTSILVSFDIDMDPSSINETTFVVQSNLTGLHFGTFSWDSIMRTVTFTPNDEFQTGEEVTVVLTSGILSSLGISLVKSHVWSFKINALGGYGIFPTESVYTVGELPNDVSVADFDNDNDIDIVCVSLAPSGPNDPDSIYFLWNDGNGSFSNSQSVYAVAPGAKFTATADFDNDGDIDLAVLSGQFCSISIFLNDGSGVFVLGSYIPFGCEKDLKVGDVNGDGYVDLITANGSNREISILLNNGDATFAPLVDYAVDTVAESVCIGDLDNDGDLDLAVGGGSQDWVVVTLLNDGNGAFQADLAFLLPNRPSDIIAADINLDSHLDLVAAGWDHSSPINNTLSCLFNLGDGSFDSLVNYTVGEHPTSVISSDVNSDGKLDLVSGNNFDVQDDNITVLIGNGDGTFGNRVDYGTSDGPNAIASADFDGDGSLDIVIANYDAASVSVLLNLNNPEILAVAIEGSEVTTNIVNHTPLIEWNYLDQAGNPQVKYEIEFGTDQNWGVAELWDPTEFFSSDTFVVYNGSQLSDGETYYLRLRVAHDFAWSDWHEKSFRMNSVPSIPTPVRPSNDAYDTDMPILWIYNSSDSENDSIRYDFLVVIDTNYGSPDSQFILGIVEETDSTSGQVQTPLQENKRYYWQARSFDGYEFSSWTDPFLTSFYVNSTLEPPSAPEPQYPPDSSGLPVFEMLSQFEWALSIDPDPLDIVRYKLEVAIDSTFNFVYTVDSIILPPYTLTDSLALGTHYWWRVTTSDNTGLSTMSLVTRDFWTWVLGDVNHSHSFNIIDLTYYVDYIFRGGPSIQPVFVGDLNGDCGSNIIDLTYIVDRIFRGGSEPVVGCE